MEKIGVLLLTLFVGIFFLIGFGITKITTKKKELTQFATGLAFMVMMGMIIFDIIPEIQESYLMVENNQKFFMMFGFTLLGMLLLKALDIFIPHHQHHHKENEKNKKEHNDHLFHISLVTSISLIIHNMMEGISIYATGITNISTGFLMAFAVALHNIPLGIEIAVGLETTKTKEKLKKGTTVLLTLSSFLGGILLFIFDEKINDTILSNLLCITLGMLLYIALFELLKELWDNRKSKTIYIGLLVGIILNCIMVIL